MHPLILVGIFIVSSVLGYVLIKNVPSLLHTPLMSGMNALSGVTVLGAMIAVATAAYTGSKVLAVIAIALAMLNVAGGFLVTHRMLMMFGHKKEKVRYDFSGKWLWLLVGLVPAAVAGAVLARKVKMIEMPRPWPCSTASAARPPPWWRRSP